MKNNFLCSVTIDARLSKPFQNFITNNFGFWQKRCGGGPGGGVRNLPLVCFFGTFLSKHKKVREGGFVPNLGVLGKHVKKRVYRTSECLESIVYLPFLFAHNKATKIIRMWEIALSHIIGKFT